MLEVKPYTAGQARGGGGGGGGGGSYAPSAKRSRGEPRDPEDEVSRAFLGNILILLSGDAEVIRGEHERDLDEGVGRGVFLAVR